MNKNDYEMPDIESSTDDYATRFAGSTGQWFLEVQAKATSSCLSSMAPGRVLDAGGGHGQNVETVLSLHHQLYILGSAESCTHRLQENIDNGDIEFEQGYLTRMPYADRSFDASISYRMLPHLNDWQTHIAELCRVSDTLVIVDFPTLRSVNYFSEVLFTMKKKLEKNTRPFLIFKEKAVVSEFEKYGFKVDRRIGQFFFPMALHRALKSVMLSRLLEAFSRLTGLNTIFGSPLIISFRRN